MGLLSGWYPGQLPTQRPAVHGADCQPLSPGPPLKPSQSPFASPSWWSSPFAPTVTPPTVQPVSPPTVVSASLAADLEGLTLTESPLVPSVSGMGDRLGWGRDASLCCIP